MAVSDCGRIERSGGLPELLAPAGDMAALEAALEAGADAVYFGLKALNARRQARNFGRDELAEAVRRVHTRGGRAYLTLNVDLAEGELVSAARMLCWAARCGVDGVLVRDPALLALRPAVPGMEFHFSTQSCMANSADLTAAAMLGIDRAVLAREMTLEEIRAASAVAGVKTEVFVQGALCFSVSGRCLLSSWVGGRSGNRGTCTSPCRVPWTTADGQLGWPFSMHDLCTLDRLSELRRAGVAALKIEGRMKNASWVGKAVRLYRRALDGQSDPRAMEEVNTLGQYTGRQLTSGYLDGRREGLTATAGRPPRSAPAGQPFVSSAPGEVACGYTAVDLAIDVGSRGIECRCRCGQHVEQWTIPKTVVRRPERAVTIGQLLDWLGQELIEGCAPGRLTTNAPEFLLVPRAVNRLLGRVRGVVQRTMKRERTLDGVDLPEQVRSLLRPTAPHAANRRTLGGAPDRVRVEPAMIGAVVGQLRPGALIVEGVTAETFAEVRRAVGKMPWIVALPPVFFEDQLADLERLLAACRRARVPVEVNSWGGWALARRMNAPMEGGPGLAVLNSLAARQLGKLGLRSVTLSIEADRRKLEQLTARCPVPCSLIVFGRPALWTTRVELPDRLGDTILQDRRNVRIRGRREGPLWVFRPVEPFDLRDQHNPRIRVAHLVVDLVGSPDPIADLRGPKPGGKHFRFNYNRTLS